MRKELRQVLDDANRRVGERPEYLLSPEVKAELAKLDEEQKRTKISNDNLIKNLIALADELDNMDGIKVKTADKLDQIIKQTRMLIDDALNKTAYIKKRNGKWCVISKKGKSLGCYPSRKAALKRLRQIEFFKHNK